MRLPLYIGLHGRRVPTWLEKVEPSHLHLTFVGIVVVTNREGSFRCRGLFGGYVMQIDGEGESVTIKGQSPSGHAGPVVIDIRPILAPWLLGVMAAAALVICGR